MNLRFSIGQYLKSAINQKFNNFLKRCKNNNKIKDKNKIYFDKGK